MAPRRHEKRRLLYYHCYNELLVLLINDNNHVYFALQAAGSADTTQSVLDKTQGWINNFKLILNVRTTLAFLQLITVPCTPFGCNMTMKRLLL